jgi:hypothetical protein
MSPVELWCQLWRKARDKPLSPGHASAIESCPWKVSQVSLPGCNERVWSSHRVHGKRLAAPCVSDPN